MELRVELRKSIDRAVTTLFLAAAPKGKIELYYCSSCKAPLFKYKGDIVMEVAGDIELELPILTKCRNPRCNRVYVIEGFAHKVK